jgi:hypothetical protein
MSLLALLLTAVSASFAQGPVPPPPMGGTPPAMMKMQQLQMELQQIDGQLVASQEQVMAANPDLEKTQLAISGKVEAAMKASPVHGPKIARFEEIRAKLEGGPPPQGDQPSPEQMQLFMEGQMLGQELQSAQMEVTAAEPLASEIKAFEVEMTAAIKAADPGAAALFERRQALIAELMALLGPAPGAPVP